MVQHARHLGGLLLRNLRRRVLRKDFAYTVFHAQEFDRRGRWKYGTNGIQPGDVIFFNWGAGGRSIPHTDHVGVVEKVLSAGRVQTIEGNTGDALLRRSVAAAPS